LYCIVIEIEKNYNYVAVNIAIIDVDKNNLSKYSMLQITTADIANAIQ